MTRTPGGRKPRIPIGRKHLSPLDGGPWLIERVFVPTASITLAGLALLVGIPYVYMELLKQPGHVFILVLMLVGATTIFAGVAMGCIGWLACRATQTCPECLQEMARGAFVCPWCRFREPPRTEEHP